MIVKHVFQIFYFEKKNYFKKRLPNTPLVSICWPESSLNLVLIITKYFYFIKIK